jgi:hypothetical protein
MADLDKVWTSVGSAGTLNQADLAKVTLHQSIIQLGTELSTQPTAAPAAGTADAGVSLPTMQAVVRYNVTPVDGLFNPAHFRYSLQFRCRGQITAKLMEVDLTSGTETARILFNSDKSSNFTVQFALENTGDRDSIPLDFNNKAYYVEATLTAPALAIGIRPQ